MMSSCALVISRQTDVEYASCGRTFQIMLTRTRVNERHLDADSVSCLCSEHIMCMQNTSGGQGIWFMVVYELCQVAANCASVKRTDTRKASCASVSSRQPDVEHVSRGRIEHVYLVGYTCNVCRVDRHYVSS